MHKKIVSTCSPNNNMYQMSLYSVYRQDTPWRGGFSKSVRPKDWNCARVLSFFPSVSSALYFAFLAARQCDYN